MKTIFPGTLRGDVAAPPSKSVAQRAVAAACLIDGESRISMGTACDDVESALRVAAGLGAMVRRTDDGYAISGRINPPASVVDCGEAGLCLRMFSAVAALFDREIALGARGSLQSRPADMVVSPLCTLGASCTTANGLPPVRVRGPLTGGDVTVDATTSSQFLTGLLIALPHCKGDSVVRAPGLKSRPYVAMTVGFLRDISVRMEVGDDLETFRIPGNQVLSPFTMTVEGDWSGASFLLVAGALAGQVSVKRLNPADSQADRRIIEALEMAGADVRINKDTVSVNQSELNGFSFDATHCPDLFPPLAALAAHCRGTTRIAGVHRLSSKESDRGAAIIEEFGKLGLTIRIEGDEMVITGGPLRGGDVDAHGDHRMAMALAVAALRAKDQVHIHGDDSINKSYPDFFRDLERLRPA